MALNASDKKILQEIVDKDGACLDSKRCSKCPFRGTCLPEFVRTKMPSRQVRMQKALDVLTFHHLLDQEYVQEQTRSSLKSSKKSR